MTGGGWTLVMKVNGNQQTFKYESALWSNNETINTDSLNLDATESKLAVYWSLSFTEIRLGMTFEGTTRWITGSVGTTAPSLYSHIAHGNYSATSIGRDVWKSLLSGSSLQPHCNKVLD